MDHSITVLSPRATPKALRDLELSSGMIYRTPRSEGYLKHKVILDTPTSSEFSFTTQAACANNEMTPKSSLDENGAKDCFISERKFYSKSKANLLSQFVKSQTELVNKNDADRQEINNITPKRKRSKSVDYRNRSKLVKLNKNVRHGVKRPKTKKTPVKALTPQRNPISDASPRTSQLTAPETPQVSEAPGTESSSLVFRPTEVKQKEKKEISVKVNNLVRMNLQCGEIKFTKSAFSPKKTPKKKSSETFDTLGVPETDDWLKSKVDNILNSLDDDGEMETSKVEGGSFEKEKFSLGLNDSTEPLSDAFQDFGVKEVVDENVFKVSDGKDERVHLGNEEPSLLFEDPMEVADANIPCHDVLAEKTDNLDEGNFITPSKKFFPVFYKTTPKNSKENLVDREKSMRESPRSTARKISDGMEQLIIDAGQKSLAPTTCPVCGFFYQKGDADEENMHRMYHGSGKPGIKHMGWKWERIATKFPEGRVIRVCPGDPKTWWTKVDSVLEKANDDLGITFTSKLPKNAQAYMFVGDGYILGCVIAEPIRVAYRLLEGDRKEMENVEVDENKSLEIPKVPSFCSNTPVRGSRCGINRMWTCASERRKGIATKILDSIRATFVYGHIVRLNELAFSDPTPLGLSFAQKYTKTASILVYKPCSD